MIDVRSTDLDVRREPLSTPFGFKGSYLTELWQPAVVLENEEGTRAVGVGTQSVLWSAPEVFRRESETGGNLLMLMVTRKALNLIQGCSFDTPFEMLDELLEELVPYGRSIAETEDLPKTFLLNALVPVDNAAWMLHAYDRESTDIVDVVPEAFRPIIRHRQRTVARIPVVGYDTGLDDVKQLVEDGHFFLKIKTGHPGDREEMLEKDKRRLERIHKAVRSYSTPHSEDGNIKYYVDVNGRYPDRSALVTFLDHAREIGALRDLLILEEPFPESSNVEVENLPVRVAADESAHTARDTRRKIEEGYGAVALKPVAKTLSMTLRMAKVARKHGVPCFCADLTANPVLVEWNKNVAARLASLPGLNTSVLETNGHQNYANWEAMKSLHPCSDASWVNAKDGVFQLNDRFFDVSGGIFRTPGYDRLLFQSRETP